MKIGGMHAVSAAEDLDCLTRAYAMSGVRERTVAAGCDGGGAESIDMRMCFRIICRAPESTK